eukprot:TRINITY_DN39309_c0_g1_i1.p2 TRINITY_DN39309_c0_g1~~TRINITY_DN39309_c0_g1_i1.p2  ORF type:complete len:510 (-),score=151.49 TRINITY_DN39309_c0_g1_i1:1769-3298(-)
MERESIVHRQAVDRLRHLGLSLMPGSERFESVVDGRSYTFENTENHAQVVKEINEFVLEEAFLVYELRKFVLPPVEKSSSSGTVGSEDEYVLRSPEEFEIGDTVALMIPSLGDKSHAHWSPSATLMQSVHMGTMFPYIDGLHDIDVSVIVANPFPPTTVHSIPTSESSSTDPLHEDGVSESPVPDSKERHDQVASMLRVWDDMMMAHMKRKKIVIIAHGYGAVLALEILRRREEEFMKSVFSVVFLDPFAHAFPSVFLSPMACEYLSKICHSWVHSEDPQTLQSIWWCQCRPTASVDPSAIPFTALFDVLQHIESEIESAKETSEWAVKLWKNGKEDLQRSASRESVSIASSGIEFSPQSRSLLIELLIKEGNEEMKAQRWVPATERFFHALEYIRSFAQWAEVKADLTVVDLINSLLTLPKGVVPLWDFASSVSPILTPEERAILDKHLKRMFTSVMVQLAVSLMHLQESDVVKELVAHVKACGWASKEITDALKKTVVKPEEFVRKV